MVQNNGKINARVRLWIFHAVYFFGRKGVSLSKGGEFNLLLNPICIRLLWNDKVCIEVTKTVQNKENQRFSGTSVYFVIRIAYSLKN